MELKCLVFSMMAVFTPATITAETGDDLKAVLDDVLVTRKYNKDVRPVIDQGRTLKVTLDFYLNSIVEFNERAETLKTTGYLFISWYDDYFTWSPESFNGTEYVLVPQDKVWKPDITLRNSFENIQWLGSSLFSVHVQYNGSMIWIPFQVFQSTCSVSVTYFPFDEQTCSLKFAAWSFNVHDVFIEVNQGVLLKQYLPSATWKLVQTAVEYAATVDPEVIFKLTLKRKPRFYIINLIMPLILLSLLNTFSFMLPVTSGERAGYSITVFLSLAIFLTIVSEQLPQNSESTPLLSIYILSVTTLSTFTVLLCLIQLRMQSWYDTEQPVSRFFQGFVRVCNNIRCKRCKKSLIEPLELVSKNGIKDGSNTEKEMIAEQPMTTWLDVINAMDFSLFLISFIYTFICTVVIGVATVKNL